MTYRNCPCSLALAPSGFNEGVTAFYELVQVCSALRLAIPAEIAEQHQAFTRNPLDDANHASVPFLAFRRNRLLEFTASIHALLTDESGVRLDIVNQYKKDLQETWLFQTDSSARFQKARSFVARLAELDLVMWLLQEGWRITQLELYGGQFDIEAVASDGTAFVFEVKFLAQREVVFELGRASFVEPTPGYLGVYSPIDYLTFRLYEAAKQLRGSTALRIAVAIVSDYEISYKIPLSENWIDWKCPKFLRMDGEIVSFLEKQLEKNPNLDSDLRASMKLLNEIWVMRYTEFGLVRVHRYGLSSSE